MTDHTKADIDKNKILSPFEALSLGFVLSVDSLSVGLGLGFFTSYPYLAVIFSAVLTFFSIIFGSYLGRKVSKSSINLSWLSGFILILLAFSKLL